MIAWCLLAVTWLILAVWWLHRTGRLHLPHRSPPVVDRSGWCSVCGCPTHGRTYHEIRTAPQDGLDGPEGGTIVGAEFCPTHCPGTGDGAVCIQPGH